MCIARGREGRDRMEADGADVLEDHIEYALLLGRAGDRAGGRAVRSLLEAMFAYRHRVTADDLAAHAAAAEAKP